jgi:hypothetical protein
MIIKDPNFHKLHETKEFIVGYVYECAYLINKRKHKKIHMGDFYGDPKCGLIDSNNNWCFVGGNILSVWTTDRGIVEIEDKELAWICRARQVSDYDVELLIDPWSYEGSVWAFNIKTLERHKVKDYKLDGEYSEQIDW